MPAIAGSVAGGCAEHRGNGPDAGERLVSPPLLIGLGRRSCPRRWTRVSTAKGGHFRARIDAASTQVSPLEWRGEALDLPGDQSARRVGGASGAATWAER